MSVYDQPQEVIEDLFSDESREIRNYKRKTWQKEGVIHRDNDLPAIQIFKPGEETPFIEEWWRHGSLHREKDQPASICRNDWVEQKFYHLGKLHRDCGPAVIVTTNNINVREEYYHNGEMHRVDDPALICRDDATANLSQESWYQAGKLHRIDGPSEREWIGGGNVITSEAWHRHGQLHRDGGPAVTIRDYKTGNVTYEASYKDDTILSEWPEQEYLSIEFELLT